MTSADPRETIHFVTGKLAEPVLREIVASLASKQGFDYSIDVLPITVAALMTPSWLLKHMRIPDQATRVILPGYLQTGIETIRAAVNTPIECGPKDVRDLPTLFGRKRFKGDDYGQYSIEILAEINYAPRLSLESLLGQSQQLVLDGADRIDLGCEPGHRWIHLPDAVKALRQFGIVVSIDTFDPWEASEAVKAGATLVLSVNQSNREAAVDWGCEVVVVPDDTFDFLPGLMETAEYLDKHGVAFRLDPILEPIGCGFSASLGRYLKIRAMFPEAAMMMGIGNITELTDCDSAGLNTLLLGFCEEQQIGSVLTTQVIPWAKSSVRECDLSRRLVNYAIRHKIPPKHLEDRLVMLRDPTATVFSAEAIAMLASNIKDNNYRILIDADEIHLVSAGVHIRGTDPFLMMEQLMQLPQSRNVDVSHAFYLGFELNKALTALTLGKRYEQDESLTWGMHTRSEKHRRLPRNTKSRTQDGDGQTD
jgi:dihydropteroate synthase-like protein